MYYNGTEESGVVSFAYAYSPRENVGSRGKVHVVAERPIVAGRLARDVGETLCTRKRFWGLDGRSREQFERVACPKCAALLAKLESH